MHQPQLSAFDPNSNASHSESEKRNNSQNTVSDKSQKTTKSLASSRSLFGKGNQSLFRMNFKSN